ncbi:hypothetical protein L1887_47635 [Cichorium endivia]|nr:hypothetical protein L1887_47635 [Cichorium endivia]
MRSVCAALQLGLDGRSQHSYKPRLVRKCTAQYCCSEARTDQGFQQLTSCLRPLDGMKQPGGRSAGSARSEGQDQLAQHTHPHKYRTRSHSARSEPQKLLMMRLAVLSFLLAISLCASAPTGGNVDLTLRLGPASTPQAASDGSTPTDLTLRLGPAYTPDSPGTSDSSTSSAAVQDLRGASSRRLFPFIPRLRTVDPGNLVGPDVRARRLWEYYTRYHLNTPVPAVIQDGRFHAQEALMLQRRIESLVRAKTLFIKLNRGRSFSKSEMEVLTRRFLNWRKVTKKVASGRASVFAPSNLRAEVADDIQTLQRDEELLRRIAH